MCPTLTLTSLYNNLFNFFFLMYVTQCRGFQLDTFARNEGDGNKIAHFKFVFSPYGADSARIRSVLDVLHDRGRLSVRLACNGGPTLCYPLGQVMEYRIRHVGRVVFSPREQAKGDHLYILSLKGRTLFSILA
ncbi:unnamed protein product [Choristocarpus tenellus]